MTMLSESIYLHGRTPRAAPNRRTNVSWGANKQVGEITPRGELKGWEAMKNTINGALRGELKAFDVKRRL